MASSILSSTTVTPVKAQANMVAPFTGLKSNSAFPVTRNSNNDFSSLPSNGCRVRCKQLHRSADVPQKKRQNSRYGSSSSSSSISKVQ